MIDALQEQIREEQIILERRDKSLKVESHKLSSLATKHTSLQETNSQMQESLTQSSSIADNKTG